MEQPGNKYRIIARASIDAPIENVWEVLTNIHAYPEWNPFIVKVEASQNEPVVNTLMKFSVRWPSGGGQSSSEKVTVYTPPVKKDGKWFAQWCYDFTGPLDHIGMVKADRVHTLEQEENGPVQYYTCESFSGWGKIFLPLKKVRAGFGVQTAAMKQRCEDNKKEI